MRWSSPPESVTKPIAWVLLAITSPVWGLLIVALWTDRLWWSWFGPKSTPKPWFAWRPIRFNEWFEDDTYGRWVWLETVERQYDQGETVYRPLAALSKPSSRNGDTL